MLNDAIRLLAAAFCCEAKKIEIPVTLEPELGKVLDMLLRLSSVTEVSSAGIAYMQTPVHAPNRITVRCGTLPRDLFFLFGGICARQDIVFFARSVEPDVTREELQALCDALDGVMCFVKKPSDVILSAVSEGYSLKAEVEVPPVFVAGMLIGSALTYRDTDYNLGKYRDTEPVRFAMECMREYGALFTEHEDGTLTVHTLRPGRFDLTSGRRLRRRK